MTVPVSRRAFLQTGGLALAGLAGVLRPAHGQEAPAVLPPYVADLDGDGIVSALDERLARTALFTRRGFAIRPDPRYDYRADVFGRGNVDPIVLESIARTLGELPQEIEPVERRPITIAWHYGWYNSLPRQPAQTVRFLTGNYVSFDPVVEEAFNQLKNEFGITVDALSWIPRRANRDLFTNYRSGYLKTPSLRTRHVALLYESTISLPLTGQRIDFTSDTVRFLLRDDFEQMAHFLAEVRDTTPARTFMLDGRPVIFIFGSHAWGRLPVDRFEFDRLADALALARKRFVEIYGLPPYIVGEEALLSPNGAFSDDRQLRAENCDAIFTYHHAANIKPGTDVTLAIDQRYLEAQQQRLLRTYEGLSSLRSRATGAKVLLIPSLAPGFAKPGFPTLQVSRGDYADFIKVMMGFHKAKYLQPEWYGLLGGPQLPAPIFSVGSWNEEFEGHCVFPSSFNLALSEVRQQGFDIPMALREAFGWNHYAERDLL